MSLGISVVASVPVIHNLPFMQDRPQMCWVAELHYRGLEPPKNVTDVYNSISPQNLEGMGANLCRKKVGMGIIFY